MFKRFYFLMFLMSFWIVGFSQLQLNNSGFNNWYTYNSSYGGGQYDMPNNWSGSNVHDKMVINVNVKTIHKETSNLHEGTAALKCMSAATFSGFPNSPGFISPARFWYHMDSRDAGFYMNESPAFTGRPESLKVWIKADPKAGDISVIRIVSWAGEGYNGRNNKYVNDDIKISDTRWESSTRYDEWTEIEVPINYIAGKEGVIPTKMNVIFSSSDYDNSNTSVIKEGSALWVDDFKFVYPAKLKDVKLDGELLANFTPSVLTYNIPLPLGTTIPPLVSAVPVLGGSIIGIKPAATVPGTTEITVRSEDGVTLNTYKFNFTAPKLFTVTTQSTVGGDVVITDASADNRYGEGEVIELTAIQSDDSYHFVRWWDNSTSNPRSYTVIENRVVSAVFEKRQFTITATAGANGTVTPAGVTKLAYGSGRTYSITPNSGYGVEDVLVDNVSVGAVASYAFDNVTDNHVISATFKAQDYIVNIPASEAFVVVPIEGYDPEKVAFGENFKFSVQLNYGYTESKVVVKSNNVLLNAVDGVYTINNVDRDQTIVVSGITKSEYNLDIVQGVGGVISRNPIKSKYQYKEQVALTATPNKGWKFVRWWDDKMVNPYLYTVVDNDVVSAVFEEKEAVTISVDNSKLVYDYDGNAKSVVFETQPAGLDCVVTYNGLTIAPTNVGVYEVIISRAEDDDYKEAVPIVIMMTIVGLPTQIDVAPTASAVNEGVMLSRSILSGGVANVDGEFVWETPNKRMLQSGNYSVVFVPENPNYLTSHTDVYVEVLPAADYFTVTVGEINNGRVVIPNKDANDKYADGSDVELIAIGDDGYVFSEWWNGDKSNPTTVNVSGNIEVVAQFVLDSYKVSFCNVEGASFVSDLDEVQHGGEFRFSVAIDDVYSQSVIEVRANGVLLSKDGEEYVIENVKADQAVTVSGVVKNQYSLVAKQTLGGVLTIVPSKNRYEHGEIVTLLADANVGYRFKDWFSAEVGVDGRYTVIGDVEVSATFETKDNIVVTYDGLNAVYDGTEKGISYTTTPEGLECVVRYDGVEELPTEAGQYSVNVSREEDEDYLRYDKSLVITIQKAVSTVISVPSATTILVGDKLSTSVLDGGLANVEGYFEWKTADFVPTVTGEYDAVFVPSNVNYERALCRVAVGVIQKYSVTIGNSLNGTVTIKESTENGVYMEGSVLSLEAKSSENYHFVSWWDGNTSQVRNYTVEGNRVITANFKKDSHTLVADCGDNGWITPSGIIEVEHGVSKRFVITPQENYVVDVVTVDGNEVQLNEYGELIFDNITTNHNINATFKLVTHTITATVEGNGTISIVGENIVEHGTDVVYEMKPAKKWRIGSIKVDGKSMVVTDSYTFVNVSGDHTIDVVFVEDPTGVNFEDSNRDVKISSNGKRIQVRIDGYDYIGSDCKALIYDLSGRVVRQLNIDNADLNVTMDKGGVYVVKVVDRYRVLKVGKVIVN